jgi:hypothetical protein
MYAAVSLRRSAAKRRSAGAMTGSRGEPGGRADSAPGSTSNTSGSDRPGGQARGADRLTAVLTCAVAAISEPDHRRVDLGEVLTGLAEQGRDMLTLERERGALGIVLVIGASRTRLDDPRELSPKPVQPLEDSSPLRR